MKISNAWNSSVLKRKRKALDIAPHGEDSGKNSYCDCSAHIVVNNTLPREDTATGAISQVTEATNSKASKCGGDVWSSEAVDAALGTIDIFGQNSKTGDYYYLEDMTEMIWAIGLGLGLTAEPCGSSNISLQPCASVFFPRRQSRHNLLEWEPAHPR